MNEIINNLHSTPEELLVDNVAHVFRTGMDVLNIAKGPIPTHTHVFDVDGNAVPTHDVIYQCDMLSFDLPECKEALATASIQRLEYTHDSAVNGMKADLELCLSQAREYQLQQRLNSMVDLQDELDASRAVASKQRERLQAFNYPDRDVLDVVLESYIQGQVDKRMEQYQEIIDFVDSNSDIDVDDIERALEFTEEYLDIIEENVGSPRELREMIENAESMEEVRSAIENAVSAINEAQKEMEEAESILKSID